MCYQPGSTYRQTEQRPLLFSCPDNWIDVTIRDRALTGAVDVLLTRPCSVVAVCEQSLARQRLRLLCVGDGMSLRPEPYDNDKDAEPGDGNCVNERWTGA